MRFFAIVAIAGALAATVSLALPLPPHYSRDTLVARQSSDHHATLARDINTFLHPRDSDVDEDSLLMARVCVLILLLSSQNFVPHSTQCTVT